MVSYPYQMPMGIPGNVTRPEISTIEQFIANQTTPPTVFGVPVKNVSAKIQPIAAGDLSSAIIGFLARPYPTTGNGTDGLGVATPNKALPMDVLKRGYINVAVGGTTPPTSGSPVYVRVGNASTGKVIGDVEAAADIGVTAAATVGTGTQTAGTLSALVTTPAGVYTVKMTSGSAFDVLDASGAELLHSGVFATQYTLDNGLSFKMTTGGTPTAGDTTAITVAQNTILVPGNTYFTGGMDSSNNAEVAYNI
jgi:hypothetical protein